MSRDSEAGRDQAPAAAPAQTGEQAAGSASPAHSGKVMELANGNPLVASQIVRHAMRRRNRRAEGGPAGAGGALPNDTRAKMERSFGTDFSAVRVHEGDQAESMGALAYAQGTDLHFAPGQYSPGSEQGDALIGHELAHVVQQGSGRVAPGPQGKGAPVVKDAGLEREADEAGARAGRGQPAQLSGASAGGVQLKSADSPIQLFEAGAGGHQGIEREVAGLDPKSALGEKDNLGAKEGAVGSKEAGVDAMYSGNFMQDFSQLNVPKFHEILADLPKSPTDPKGAKVGDKGGETIGNSIIRALAIIDVGPRIADQIVMGNLQNYKPEQHMDNPMGTAGPTDFLVRDSKSGSLRAAQRTVQTSNGATTQPVDKDRDQQLQGSAVPGLQTENPTLYEVNGSGLANHVYNSVEWCKNHWIQAAQAGATDMGRFHIGSGLHVLEDYFAHSNFVEVALNTYIPWALAQQKPGAGVTNFLDQVKAQGPSQQQAVHGDPAHPTTYVDTMFDAKVPGANGKPRGRQAVTTGTFGGTDTKVSIAHLLLPKVPALQGAIDHGIEKIFHVVKANPNAHGWSDIVNTMKEDRPVAAVAALADGLDTAGMTLPVAARPVLDMSSTHIPLIGDVSLPHGVHIQYEQKPVKAAISTYVGFVQEVRHQIQTVRKLLSYAKWIRHPIQTLLDKLDEMIQAELDKLKDAIKHQVATGIIFMLDSISGHDTKDEANRTIGDAAHEAHEKVEQLEHQTSMEARLAPGGDLAGLSKQEAEKVVGPVQPRPGGGWIAQNLPPSHSEVSKDHGPEDPDKRLKTHPEGNPIRDGIGGALGGKGPAALHPEQQTGKEEHPDHEEGSIFYGLARALSVEADRHVLTAAQTMWANSGSLYGDGQQFNAASQMVDSQDQIEREAAKRSANDEQRAKQDGFGFAQANPANQELMKKNPAVRGMLNLADEFISHPDDTEWWKPVFSTYVGSHPDEVARHIRERNSTRALRTGVK